MQNTVELGRHGSPAGWATVLRGACGGVGPGDDARPGAAIDAILLLCQSAKGTAKEEKVLATYSQRYRTDADTSFVAAAGSEHGHNSWGCI